MSLFNFYSQRLNLQQSLKKFWRMNAPMTFVGVFTFVLLLLMLPGLLIDERVITGAPAWLKPCKFAFSTSVYSFTFVWLLGLFKQHQRLASLAANVTAFALVVQIIVIIVQVIRGTTSHFNFSTPEDEALWKFMEIALLFLWAATLVTAILLLLERLDNPVLAIALRFSLFLTFIGMGLGFFMTLPTPEQNSALAASQPVLHIGAHSVGVKDGGPGIPILYLSTQGGDIRLPHLLGIHAVQALPLVSWFITSVLSHLEQRTQTALMWIASFAYAMLMSLFTWQALRAQPITSPDALTLTALAGLVAVTLVATGITLFIDRYQLLKTQSFSD
ncbi:hypothetical protein [Nostoc sp. UHCC 0252]|uniref:hypothetical protein n=1 Tax=Nostoc sp. UHCC 0252 TaxID=3110241 RepID=UPI002B21D972|nr:hypothetical protein [Nostoc sp. UHCC 0252]MEA5602850.1 hypothetical protein [Nostoc sp. UHCC 0252]